MNGSCQEQGVRVVRVGGEVRAVPGGGNWAVDGRGSGQDGPPAVPPVVLQHRGGAVDSEGPDRVVLPINDVEDQGFGVKELTVTPQVNVTPAVPVGKAARRDESLNSLDSGVEPGGVVEAVAMRIFSPLISDAL